MGKRKSANKNKNKSQPETQKKPFVSICTPTFNRRPFIKNMIQCFMNQTYPKSRLEWIIIDDGHDKVEDIFLEANIPQVKYFKYDTKMTLGKKRNLMHEKSSGSILVYMDDDDYYPPTRVEHAVERLQGDKKAICAGSSTIHVYFKHIDKVVQFGPYSETHATAGTFAFKRTLLDMSSYDENAALAEEKHFLKNYTIPFVQLDPKHTILVFSHEHNTFDKRKLLDNINPTVTKFTEEKVTDFVKEADIYDFFMKKIDKLLEEYEPGLPKYKPDVLEQTKVLEKQREDLIKQQTEQMKIQGKRLLLTDENTKQQRQASIGEVVTLFEVSQKNLEEAKNVNQKLQIENNTIKQLLQNNEAYKENMLLKQVLKTLGIRLEPTPTGVKIVQLTEEEKQNIPIENILQLNKMPQTNVTNTPMSNSMQMNTETNNKINDESADNEDIDVISQQVPDLDRSKIIEVYKKNNKDVVDTIIELTA